ncbi:MAG: hypothetical protein JWP37_2064 [Mucilaginibacter sp.]|nr:hypothetical protein [Mucilaginibacter sp.]
MANTPLPGAVQPAAAGLSGFDVNSILSATGAQNLKNAGYDFCVRYVPRTAALAAGNLTNAEALNILNAGLALMAVQHVAIEGWVPDENLGAAYGSYAATYASEVVGLPRGMNIWCDLEGVAPGTDAADVIAYCQAWYDAVNAAGYVPGIYVGWDTMLTSQQLYSDLPFQHYWRAYNGPGVATRGFQVLQTTEKTVSGITIDPDTTQNDNLGGTALWLSTQPILAAGGTS